MAGQVFLNLVRIGQPFRPIELVAFFIHAPINAKQKMASAQARLVGVGHYRFHDRLANFARALGLNARRFVGGIKFGEEVLGRAHGSISRGLALHAVVGLALQNFLHWRGTSICLGFGEYPLQEAVRWYITVSDGQPVSKFHQAQIGGIHQHAKCCCPDTTELSVVAIANLLVLRYSGRNSLADDPSTNIRCTDNRTRDRDVLDIAIGLVDLVSCYCKTTLLELNKQDVLESDQRLDRQDRTTQSRSVELSSYREVPQCQAGSCD